MTKRAGTRTGTFTTLAVLATLTAMAAFGAQLDDDYSPICDNKFMHPGDVCIGTDGGTYDQLVAEHHLHARIVLFVALPLALFFAIYAIGEFRRGRRRRREAAGPLT